MCINFSVNHEKMILTYNFVKNELVYYSEICFLILKIIKRRRFRTQHLYYD